MQLLIFQDDFLIVLGPLPFVIVPLLVLKIFVRADNYILSGLSFLDEVNLDLK